MVEKFLESIRPCLTERLGRIYSYSNEYKKSLENETKLAEELKSTLTEEQQELLDKYHIATTATWGTCELLAYRQGMRDFASILGIENREDA